jgi:hypothetical protein
MFEDSVVDQTWRTLSAGSIPGLRVVSVSREGVFPATNVVVLFKHDTRPHCQFGMRYPVWDDDDDERCRHAGFQVNTLVANLREWIDAVDLGLPLDCGNAEVAWLDDQN